MDAMEIAAPVATGVKRKRKANNTSCDFCKRRKVKCSGGQPCEFCLKCDEECTYTEVSKRLKKADGSSVDGALVPTANVAPGEQRIATTFSRRYYLNIFLQQLNPFVGFFDSSLNATGEVPSPVLFEQNMAICFAARALGQSALVRDSLLQVRKDAGALIDVFESSAAAGFMLLSLYHFGEDNPKATHFANYARSICKQTPPTFKTRAVARLIAMSGVLMGPRRICHTEGIIADVAQLGEVCDAEESGHLARVWGTGPSERLICLSRRFPRNCSFMDMYCRTKLVARYPEAERFDSYLNAEQINTSFKTLQVQMSIRPHNAGCPYSTVMLYSTGIFLSFAGGVPALGCEFARQVYKQLQTIPVLEYGFHHARILVPVMQLGAFCTAFKLHPLQPGGDYRDFLLTLAAMVRPLIATFVSARSLLELLCKRAEDDATVPASFVARPDQQVIIDEMRRAHPILQNLHASTENREFWRPPSPPPLSHASTEDYNQDLALLTMPQTPTSFVARPSPSPPLHGPAPAGACPAAVAAALAGAPSPHSVYPTPMETTSTTPPITTNPFYTPSLLSRGDIPSSPAAAVAALGAGAAFNTLLDALGYSSDPEGDMLGLRGLGGGAGENGGEFAYGGAMNVLGSPLAFAQLAELDALDFSSGDLV